MDAKLRPLFIESPTTTSATRLPMPIVNRYSTRVAPAHDGCASGLIVDVVLDAIMGYVCFQLATVLQTSGNPVHLHGDFPDIRLVVFGRRKLLQFNGAG